MNAGELRNRVTIQKNKGDKNSYGQLKDEWEDVCTVWASINPLVGKQYFDAETINNELTHKVKIRYNKNVESGMRVCFKGRIFDIVGPPINYQERNTELQLMCSETL